jgi:hypothetical protein
MSPQDYLSHLGSFLFLSKISIKHQLSPLLLLSFFLPFILLVEDKKKTQMKIFQLLQRTSNSLRQIHRRANTRQMTKRLRHITHRLTANGDFFGEDAEVVSKREHVVEGGDCLALEVVAVG